MRSNTNHRLRHFFFNSTIGFFSGLLLLGILTGSVLNIFISPEKLHYLLVS